MPWGAQHKWGAGDLRSRILGRELSHEERPEAQPQSPGALAEAASGWPCGLGPPLTAVGGEGQSQVGPCAKVPPAPPAGPSSPSAPPGRVCEVGAFHTLKMHPNLEGKEEALGATGRGQLPSSFSTGLSVPPQVAFAGKGLQGSWPGCREAVSTGKGLGR